jgi:hypothetical protein
MTGMKVTKHLCLFVSICSFKPHIDLKDRLLDLLCISTTKSINARALNNNAWLK